MALCLRLQLKEVAMTPMCTLLADAAPATENVEAAAKQRGGVRGARRRQNPSEGGFIPIVSNGEDSGVRGRVTEIDAIEAHLANAHERTTGANAAAHQRREAIEALRAVKSARKADRSWPQELPGSKGRACA